MFSIYVSNIWMCLLFLSIKNINDISYLKLKYFEHYRISVDNEILNKVGRDQKRRSATLPEK